MLTSKMNIADIEKIANRKRISAQAEELRAKVRKETKNIIKLRVAQDTAYCDLKEQYQQLESNHERLQQNMVEGQMQREAISGKYQEELRLRQETLNKLSSTHKTCNDLDEYTERLKASVSRCMNDQATFAEACKKTDQEIKDKQSQDEEKNLQIISNQQEQIKLLVDHKEQMIQVFNASKQHLELELKDAQSKLATAQGQKDELFIALNDSSRKLEQTKRELEEKEENYASLETEMKKYIDEYNNKTLEMKNVNLKQAVLLKECTASNESLKKALQKQEQFTRSVCDQNNKMQEKISVLEEEHIVICNKNKNLELKLEDSNSQCEKYMKNIQELNVKIEEFQHEIEDKRTLVEQSLIEKQNLNDRIVVLEEQKSVAITELNNAKQESELRSIKIQEISLTVEELQAKISQSDTVLENNKIDNENKIVEINCILEKKVKIIEEKDKELDFKASTINKLMSDVKNGIDAKTKLESDIDKLRKEIATEKNIAKDMAETLSKKVEKLEIAAKEREVKLSKQMSIILEMRNEKERLQERLKEKQNIIDNIKKEVTRTLRSTATTSSSRIG